MERTVYMLDNADNDLTIGYWRNRELAEKRAVELNIRASITELHPPDDELLHGACEDDYGPNGELLSDPTRH